jgi:hypothetical protein
MPVKGVEYTFSSKKASSLQDVKVAGITKANAKSKSACLLLKN